MQSTSRSSRAETTIGDRETRIRAAVDELAAALLAAVAEATPSHEQPDRLMSVAEAAEALSLGRSRIYDEIGAMRLRSIKVGSRRLIPSSAVAEFIDGASGR